MEEILKAFVADKVLFFGTIGTLLFIIIIIVALVSRGKKLKTLEEIVEKDPLEENSKIKEISRKPIKAEIPKEEEKKEVIETKEEEIVDNQKEEKKDKVIVDIKEEEKELIEAKRSAEVKKELEEKINSYSANTEYSHNKTDLEKMLDQMQADLEKKHDDIATFEEEQEENSIISYQELVNKLKSKSENNVKMKEPTMVQNNEINEVKKEKPAEPKIVKEPAEIEEVKERKFRSSEVISPIYGRVNKSEISTPKKNQVSYQEEYEKEENKGNNVDLEKTLKMAPISKEIKRNEDFLLALKEFRNNL